MGSAAARIQTGETERIEVYAGDSRNDPVTGLTTLKLTVRRISDDYFLDWSDMTFKASGWTAKEATMLEVSAANAPGDYYYLFDTSSITNATPNDAYMMTVDEVGSDSVPGAPFKGELKVGQWVDHLDDDITSRAQPGDEMNLVPDINVRPNVDVTYAATVGRLDVAVSLLEGGQRATNFDSVSLSVHLDDVGATLVHDYGTETVQNADGVFAFSDTGISISVSTRYILRIVAVRGTDTWNLQSAFKSIGECP